MHNGPAAKTSRHAIVQVIVHTNENIVYQNSTLGTTPISVKLHVDTIVEQQSTSTKQIEVKFTIVDVTAY